MKKADSNRSVAAYIRVSTQRQAEEGDSLEAQEHALKEWAGRSRSDRRLELYIERGRSGKNQNRPELQRLKRDIRDGKIEFVVCVKLDRITRSLLDFAELWEFFQEYNIEFTSLKENVDTSSPMGKAMLMIIMVFAQLEREVTGERTRITMQDRTRRGLWNGKAPHGYVSDEDGVLRIDPEWSLIIKKHFFDAVEKLGSAGAVQKSLRQNGIRTPNKKSTAGSSSGGKWFAKQQVLRVLRNPAYVGDIDWGGVKQSDCHEAIISRRQFERVQQLLHETATTRANTVRIRDRVYRLKGLIRCRCGAVMTPKSANGRSSKYHYYECTRKTHHGRAECSVKGIPAEALEKAVVDRMINIGLDPTIRQKIASEALKLVEGEAQSASDDFRLVSNQLSALKSEIGRLVGSLKQFGSNVPRSVVEELTKLESEERNLEARKNQMAEKRQPWDKVTQKARDFIQSWTSVGDLLKQADLNGQKTLMRSLIHRLELQPDAEEKGAGAYRLILNPGWLPEPNENGDPVLTGPPMVRHVSEKAPRAKPSS